MGLGQVASGLEDTTLHRNLAHSASHYTGTKEIAQRHFLPYTTDADTEGNHTRARCKPLFFPP